MSPPPTGRRAPETAVLGAVVPSDQYPVPRDMGHLQCPRCDDPLDGEQFYGPCARCREELRAAMVLVSERVPAAGYMDQRGQSFVTCELCQRSTEKSKDPAVATGWIIEHLDTEHDVAVPDGWSPKFFDR